MSFDYQTNVADSRVTAELEQMQCAETRTAVLSRWERKSLARTAGTALPCAATADRFIPSRSVNRDMQAVNMQEPQTENNAQHQSDLPSAHALKDALFDGAADTKILAFKDKPAPAPAGHLNHLRVLYSQQQSGAALPKKSFRHINTSSDRILDAPALSDDFYLNLLDWSAQNTLAVALGASVYLWNAQSGDIDLLTELDTADNNSVTSLAWSADGNFLSVGTHANTVQLWNVEAKKQLRTLRGHSARVGALAWNGHVLSSGSRDSLILNHDVRIAQHKIATLRGHSLEVCGLKWSDDGTTLASGGNDNLCHVWDHAAGEVAPRFAFAQHTAAVKALAWCPWQRHVLATGAGTADRHIRLFNTQTSALLSATDTESQVCSLQWGRHDKELVSAHGFSQNQLTVWRASGVGAAVSTGATAPAPVLQKMADLTGHTARILHTAVSPDGTTVCSAGADETLRFWKVWDAPAAKRASVSVGTAAVGKAAGGRMAAINIR